MTPRSPSSESPQTQELIKLCLSLSEHPENLAALKEKTEVRLEEMHRAEDAFFAGVESKDPEFYQDFRPHIDQVEEEFRAYGNALEMILDETFDPQQAAQSLATASRGLRVSMGCYEEAFLSQGSSRFPVLNLFRNVFSAVSAGSMPRPVWLATCSRYRAYYSGAVEEIEKSQAAGRPGVPERKAALVSVVMCLDELQVLEEVTGLEPILTRLTSAHEDLDQAFDTYHRHEFSEGPTGAPKINWLVKAAQGVLSGSYDPEVLESMAQELLDITQQNLVELKAMSRNKLDSAVLTEELERMIEAVEDIEDTLIFLLEYAQGAKCDKKQVNEAIEDLMESGDALVESIQLVKEVHQRATHVTCVQCQTLQEKGAKSCVACGAILPQLPQEGTYSTTSSFQVLEGDPADLSRDEVMTDVMHELFQACEAFMGGKQTFQDLSPRLDASLKEVEKAQATLHRLQSPVMPDETTPPDQELAANFIDLAEDALILLSQGTAECQNGLLTMRNGAQLDDLEALRAGMRQYFEGTQKMLQVKRLDKKFSEYLEVE